MNKKQKKLLTRILVSLPMVAALHFVPVHGLLQLALYLVPYLIVGHDILKKAVKGIGNHQVFDENFLMAVPPWALWRWANMPRAAPLCCFTRWANGSSPMRCPSPENLSQA